MLQQYIATVETVNRPNPVIEQTKTINVGTLENPQELQIGTTLNQHEETQLTKLLTEFNEVFAWSYKEMSGIDCNIAEHRIPIKPGYKPVTQKLRKIKPEWSIMVKEEIKKQLQDGFIQVIEYAY